MAFRSLFRSEAAMTECMYKGQHYICLDTEPYTRVIRGPSSPNKLALLDRSRQDGLAAGGATPLPADPERPFSTTPHPKETAIHITISPAGGQRFHARVEDRHLCTSRTPFLAAARVLMKEGADPGTPITMSHEGACTVSLRSTVGQAAKL